MRSVLTDTKPITDAASHAASSIRDALDHVPKPDLSRLPDNRDLPDLSDLGDSVVELVGSVGDVAGKTVGVVSGATTAALGRLGLVKRPKRRRRAVIGGMVVVALAAVVVMIARRSRSTAGDSHGRDAARTHGDNADTPTTPLVAAVS